MALVERDIAGGNNNYTTIAAFFADLGDAAYTANDVVGYLYGNHTASTQLTLNSTNPASVTLKPATGNVHDGTQDGGGCTVTSTTHLNALSVARDFVTLEDIRFVFNGSGSYANLGVYLNNGYSGLSIRRCLFFSDYTARTAQYPTGVILGSATTTNPNVISNCGFARFYNSTTSNGLGVSAAYGNNSIVNCTFFDCYQSVNGSSNTTLKITNNVSVAPVSGTDYVASSGSATKLNNGWDGATFGTSPVEVTSAVLADTTPGTIDFHLASGSTVCYSAGIDATSYGTDVNIDIDGETRSGSWDIGADQYVSAGAPATAEVSPVTLTWSAPSVRAKPRVIYFGGLESDLLAAVDIFDDIDVAVRLSGAQNGNLVMRDARRFAIPYYTRKPRTTDRMGMAVCLSGADKGFYWNTGTEVLLAAAFSEDGSYADATWDNKAFGSASALATSSVTPESSATIVSGADTGALTLGQLPEVVVHWKQSAVPTIYDAPGHYGVQTGGSRGWYFNDGTTVHTVLATYTKDGRWPV